MASYQLLPLSHQTPSSEQDSEASDQEDEAIESTLHLGSDGSSSTTSADDPDNRSHEEISHRTSPSLDSESARHPVKTVAVAHQELNGDEDSSPASGPKLTKRISALLADGWLLEIAGLTTSVALFIGLVILFSHWNGKEASLWTAKLSFTAVIAIIAKSSQVSFTISISSCLGQLGWLHFRKRHAVSDIQRFGPSASDTLGATRLLIAAPSVLAILSFIAAIGGLGYEAALQQSLRLVGPNSIPVMTQLREFTEGSRPGIMYLGMLDAAMSVFTWPTLSEYDYVVPGSLVNALLHEPPKFVDYSCTEGCKPPRYATLSMCVRCDRIGSAVGNSNDTSICVPGGGCVDVANHTLLLAANTIAPANGSWDGPLTLANFTLTTVLAVDDVDVDSPAAYIVSQQCLIETCVKIYQLDISKGTTGATGAKELPLANFTDGVGDFGTPGHRLWNLTIPEDKANEYLGDNAAGWDRGRGTYSIDYDSWSFLSRLLRSLFTGQGAKKELLQPEFAGYSANFAQLPSGPAFWNFFADSARSGPLDIHNATKLQGAEDWINTLLNMITSRMANWIRDNRVSLSLGWSPEGTNPVMPVIRRNMYQIQWAWLVLPAVVELCVACLLIGTILATRRAKVPVWKQNVLAIMFRGVQPPASDGTLYTDKIAGMEAMADKLCVGLEQTSSGYRLVRSAEAP